jgi:hypothetical protein
MTEHAVAAVPGSLSSLGSLPDDLER